MKTALVKWGKHTGWEWRHRLPVVVQPPLVHLRDLESAPPSGIQLSTKAIATGIRGTLQRACHSVENKVFSVQ